VHSWAGSQVYQKSKIFIPLENKQDPKTEVQIQNRFDPVAHVLLTFSD
jgi:hypothetical protein